MHKEKEPSKHPKIAIIGGGAAGLMAAIVAKRRGADLHIFEQNDRIGKKILASGNGRCNISNKNPGVDDYAGTDQSFVSPALKTFGFKEFETFCASIGLLLNVKEDGRIYPRSDEAKAVTLAFESTLRRSGAHIYLHSRVNDIQKRGETFILEVNGESLEGFDKVLLTTGSKAAPQLGGNEDGMKLAEPFGHDCAATYPSLVQLHLDSPWCARMSGVKQQAEVTLYCNKKKDSTIPGDILFTKYGLSGFAILDISQRAVPALLKNENVELGLNLLPEFDLSSLTTQLTHLAKAMQGEAAITMLSVLLPSKMAVPIASSLNLPKGIKAESLNAKQIKQLAHLLQDWRFKVTGDHGFQHAEVSGGGILTKDVDPKTMESRLVPGLFFSGEVLDIVGKRGGYNLHFAWASGYLAGNAMTKV